MSRKRHAVQRLRQLHRSFGAVLGRGLVATMIGRPTLACAQSSPCGSNALSHARSTDNVSSVAHVPSPATCAAGWQSQSGCAGQAAAAKLSLRSTDQVTGILNVNRVSCGADAAPRLPPWAFAISLAI